MAPTLSSQGLVKKQFNEKLGGIWSPSSTWHISQCARTRRIQVVDTKADLFQVTNRILMNSEDYPQWLTIDTDRRSHEERIIRGMNHE